MGGFFPFRYLVAGWVLPIPGRFADIYLYEGNSSLERVLYSEVELLDSGELILAAPLWVGVTSPPKNMTIPWFINQDLNRWCTKMGTT